MKRFTDQDLLNKGYIKVDGSWVPQKDRSQAILNTKPKNKYRNQTVERDGVKYDSKLEYYMKGKLEMAGITFVMKKPYVLVDKFKYNGEAVRAAKVIPDFTITKDSLSVAIVDTKGMQTEKSLLQFKLLKRKLLDLNHEIPIYLPTSRKECEEVILQLISIKNQQV